MLCLGLCWGLGCLTGYRCLDSPSTPKVKVNCWYFDAPYLCCDMAEVRFYLWRISEAW
nr:MAG TPA: hypothetical protein [Caudoviricetes sp.]